MVSIVYMVAGLSSRFGGRIKQFAEVGPNGETFIEHSLNQALKNPFNKIIFIVGEHTEQPFKEKFGNEYKGIPIEYAYQIFNPEIRDKPWGTGDAFASAADLIEDSCIVCNGDDMYGEEAYEILFNHLENTEEDCTGTLKLSKMLPENGEVTRGIFTVENDYIKDANEIFNISKINYKEKGLDEDAPVNINLFGIQKPTLLKLKERVNAFKEKNDGDRKIECFIHVELANVMKENISKMKVFLSEEPWLGITNPEDELSVKKALSDHSI